MVNGISDHDAQIIILHDVTMVIDTSNFYLTRKINKASVLDFNLKLSYESWNKFKFQQFFEHILKNVLL